MKPPNTATALASELRSLLGASRNLAAVDLARLAMAAHPDAPELTYLFALACLRAGALDTAEEAIAGLRQATLMSDALHADVESLAGRLAKERYLAEIGADARKRTLGAAIDAYRRSDAILANVHARINAASLLRVAGDKAQSQVLASSILTEMEGSDAPKTHWDCATRAEALLLSNQVAQSHAAYREASRLAGNRYGDIASMRRQLSLLASVLPDAQSTLSHVPGPRVIAFSGHMIDTDDRTTERFPPALEAAVRAAIEGQIAAWLPAIAYTQAACGSDLLFCEAMLAHGQELNIVLPFARDDYVEQSVLPGGASWLPRFDRVMAAATSLTYATQERYLGDDTLFEHASYLIQGMAFLRAQELAVDPLMLVVSDVRQTGQIGGTLATQAVWSEESKAVQVIDLAELRATLPVDKTPLTMQTEKRLKPKALSPIGGGRSIKSLLFADVKGFSRLAEEFFPTFFTTFLGLVPKTLQDIGVIPLEISSRGDGLYAVFEKPDEAAHFALTLSASIGALNWAAMGLPADTHIRIALHAGPVFAALDPVTKKWAHYGGHVTRAARVEPIVIPGQVLVTEPFAAVLAARRSSAFACDLVGTETLAKDYGAARLYRLRRK